MNSANRLTPNSTRKIHSDQNPRRFALKFSMRRRVIGVMRRPRNTSPAGGSSTPGMRAGVTISAAVVRRSASVAGTPILLRNVVHRRAARRSVRSGVPAKAGTRFSAAPPAARSVPTFPTEQVCGPNAHGTTISAVELPEPKSLYAFAALRRSGSTLVRPARRRPPRWSAARISAICTALSAAPLRRLSATTHRLRPCGTVGSRRMRLT